MALGNAIELALKLRVDGDEAAKRAIQSLRSTYDAESKAIESTGKNALLSIGNAAGLSSKQMATLGAALPIVAGGVAVVGGAAAAAAAGIFEMARRTSEAGSEIHDYSERLGVSAELTSALKYAIEQTDSSLGEFAAGFTRFKKTIIEANQDSEEAIAKLKRLGIDPVAALNDLEGAAAKAFKTIYDAKPGIEQTGAATDAFGKSGDKLIGVVNQAEGDIKKLMQTAREMGVVFSKEDADAADAFGDTLSVLMAQFKGVTYTISKEFTPQITAGMQHVSDSLKQNQNVAKEWGRDIAQIMRGTSNLANSEIGKMILQLGRLAPYLTGVGALAKILKFAGDDLPEPATGEDPFGPGGSARGKTTTPIDAADYDATITAEATKKAAAEAKKAEAERLKNLKDASDARLDLVKIQLDRIRREYDIYLANAKLQFEQGNIDEEEYVRRAIKAEHTLAAAQRLANSQQRLEVSTQIDNEAQRNTRMLALKEERKKIAEDEQKRIAEIQRDGAVAIERNNLAHLQRMADIQALFDMREMGRIRERIAEGFNEAEGEAELLAVRERAYGRRRELLEQELAQSQTNLDRQREIKDEFKLINAERAIDAEETAERILAARIRERPGGPLLPSGGLPEQTEEQKRGNVLSDADLAELGPIPELDVSQQVGAFALLKEAGMDAFRSVSQGAGQMFSQFLLGEKITIKAFLGMLKGIAASVAGQALAKIPLMFAGSVEQHALALADAAYGNFAGAYAHEAAAGGYIAAAGAYGIVGGIAAGAALLIPGGGSGSTAGGGSYAGSGGSTSAGAGSYTPTVGTPVVEERSAARAAAQQPTPVYLVVESRTEEGVMVKAWIRDVRNNGEARDVSLELMGQVG